MTREEDHPTSTRPETKVPKVRATLSAGETKRAGRRAYPPRVRRSRSGWSASGPNFFIWQEDEASARNLLEDLTAGLGQGRGLRKSKAPNRSQSRPDDQETE